MLPQRAVFEALLALTVASVGLAGYEAVSRAAADRLRAKAEWLQRNAEAPRPKPSRITLTEVEINSYLAFDASDDLPVGVVSPRVTLQQSGRVTARAIVDLDAVRRAGGTDGWFDPLAYLRGQLPVTATGVLVAAGGVARVRFESAEVSGIRIPKFVLQELVTYYTRSPDVPRGIGLDDPFPLPARIRAIVVERGAAVVQQ